MMFGGQTFFFLRKDLKIYWIMTQTDKQIKMGFGNS